MTNKCCTLWTKKWKEKKGASLVVVTLMLTGILASSALVTDAGTMYFHRIQAANAADAAALAGATALPADEIKAQALALDYAARNNFPGAVAVVSEDKKEIAVQTQRTFNLFFARALGHNTSFAKAHARVRLEVVTGLKGIVPLGITEQTLVYGETYILKSGAGGEIEGEYHSGWLGILALQGPGAKLYFDDLVHGFEETVRVGDVLNIQTGNISGKTYEGVQYRIDNCKHTPACTADSYHPGCSRILLVPVIRPYAHKQVQVVSFAAFFVNTVAGMGNESEITGTFLQYTSAGETSSSGPDYGLYAPRLIQ